MSRIIMGVDPGTNKMGYGVIRVEGSKAEFIAMGYIDLAKFKSPYLKLAHIHERILGLLQTYSPEVVAFEAPFYGENVQSMLKLGRAQGVAIAAAAASGAEVVEYAPTKIKIAVSGVGSATKEQVANMLQRILSLKELPKNLDSTDGLAAAVCYHFQSLSPLKSAKRTSWNDFIKQNPEKIKKSIAKQ